MSEHINSKKRRVRKVVKMETNQQRMAINEKQKLHHSVESYHQNRFWLPEIVQILHEAG